MAGKRRALEWRLMLAVEGMGIGAGRKQSADDVEPPKVAGCVEWRASGPVLVGVGAMPEERLDDGSVTASGGDSERTANFEERVVGLGRGEINRPVARSQLQLQSFVLTLR